MLESQELPPNSTVPREYATRLLGLRPSIQTAFRTVEERSNGANGMTVLHIFESDRARSSSPRKRSERSGWGQQLESQPRASSDN